MLMSLTLLPLLLNISDVVVVVATAGVDVAAVTHVVYVVAAAAATNVWKS